MLDGLGGEEDRESNEESGKARLDEVSNQGNPISLQQLVTKSRGEKWDGGIGKVKEEMSETCR